MLRALPYNKKKWYFVIIKITIIVGVSYFIYNRLTSNAQLNYNDFAKLTTKNNIFSIKNTFLLIFLTIINWILEIFKWKTLVSYIKPISFSESAKQSLGSLTASLLTPNRIGEYGVKALYFTSTYRKRVMLLNLISNMLQMATTFIFGCIGLYYFITIYDVNINVYRVSRFALSILTIGALTILGIKNSRYKIRGFNPDRLKQFLINIPLNITFSAFILSIFRYLVFSFQFYVLLQLFNVDVTYTSAMVLISSMYLIASVVPTISFFDVVIKGGAAVYVFSQINTSDISILCITTLMWILNFVLPSIIGSFYILNFKLLK